MLWAMFVWSTVRINALFICLVNVARKPQISRCRNETSAFFRDLTAEWIGLGFTCHRHFQEGQWHGSHIVSPAQSHAPLLPFARQLLFQTVQPIFTLISKHMLFKYISIGSTRAVCSSLRCTQRKPTAFAQGFEDTPALQSVGVRTEWWVFAAEKISCSHNPQRANKHSCWLIDFTAAN